MLVGAITAPYAILLDALSFFGSGGLIFAIRRQVEPPPVTEERSMRRELVGGRSTWSAIATGGRSQ